MIERLNDDMFNFLLLGWTVPEMSGDEVMKSIRRTASYPPSIIFLTAYGCESDIVTIPVARPNGSIIKSVTPIELFPRIHLVFLRWHRRAGASDRESFGDFEFDLQLQQLQHQDRLVPLGQKEFEFALLLFRTIGRPLPRQRIIEADRRATGHIDSRGLDSHMSVMRFEFWLQPHTNYRIKSLCRYG